MSLRAAVERVHAAFEAERALERVSALAALDRYQVSEGIERAADFVAGEAERAGLEEVTITSYTAGATWWTYVAPPAWTPLAARLELVDGGTRLPLVTYPEVPCSLATFSRATPPRTAPLAILDGGPVAPEGALVVVPPGLPLGPILAELEASSALGLVACSAPPDVPAVGRIELAPQTRLLGFGVDHDGLASALAAAAAGGLAFVHAEVAASGSMPVVTGFLPGGTSDEVTFLAHLCHPRPGANDNASGVATVLGLAERYAGTLDHLDVWVLFPGAQEAGALGTRAWLKQHRSSLDPLTTIVLNVDEVGAGTVRYATKEGPLIALRQHPRLLALCRQLASEDEEDQRYLPQPIAARRPTDAYAARARGLPAITISCAPAPDHHRPTDTPDRIDPKALDRAFGFCSELIELIDEEIGPDIAATAAARGDASFTRS